MSRPNLNKEEKEGLHISSNCLDSPGRLARHVNINRPLLCGIGTICRSTILVHQLLVHSIVSRKVNRRIMGILVNMIVAVFSGGGLRGGTGNSLKRAKQRVLRSGANADKKTGMSVEFAASTVVVLDVALLAGAGGWTPSKRCIRKELNAGPTTRSSIKSCCFLSSLSFSFGAKGKACARRTRPHSSCAIASGCRPAQSQQNCIAHVRL
jgi:hypothetical protein